jgi:tetratricopeptide (TPR) repeat protein
LQPKSQAEADAWANVIKEQDVTKRIEALKQILEKFPEAGLKAVAYSSLSALHLSLGDVEKTVDFAEKAVELDPDRVDALAILTQLYARRSKPSELDYRIKMQKAENYGKHALELIDAVVKPAGLTDEQFVGNKETLAMMAHSGLGLTYFQTRRYDMAVSELKIATEPKFSQVDPVDFYVLGMAYMNTKNYAEAVTALQKAYDQTQGAFQEAISQQLANAKKLAAPQPALAPPKPQ